MPHSLFLYKQFPNKSRNLSLLPAKTVSDKQGPLHGQVAVSRHRTFTPDPGLVNPESFMEDSRSAGVLQQVMMASLYQVSQEQTILTAGDNGLTISGLKEPTILTACDDDLPISGLTRANYPYSR